jgi:hypothetical protein
MTPCPLMLTPLPHAKSGGQPLAKNVIILFFIKKLAKNLERKLSKNCYKTRVLFLEVDYTCVLDE